MRRNNRITYPLLPHEQSRWITGKIFCLAHSKDAKKDLCVTCSSSPPRRTIAVITYINQRCLLENIPKSTYNYLVQKKFIIKINYVFVYT